LPAEIVMADAACDADPLRPAIAARGAIAVVPNNPSWAFATWTFATWTFATWTFAMSTGEFRPNRCLRQKNA
jgi:hypothetical protein